MNINSKQNRSAWRLLNRVVLGMCIALGLGSVALAGDGGAKSEPSVPAVSSVSSMFSVPAWRKASRLAVITVDGVIDGVTALSVKRRVKAAENGGFDAIVLEIDSPGGQLGAVLEISNIMKTSSISNTVAWVRPDAYSGGAIIALACNEIVTSDPASMGDAFVIQMGPTGIKALSPTERTKYLPPLMADVTDSARRSGYDEYLVQAIVVDGIELWLVESNADGGQRVAINEEEYRLLFGDDVVRGKPMLAEVTGGVRTYNQPRAKANPIEPTQELSPEQGETDNAQAQERTDEPTDEPNEEPNEEPIGEPTPQSPTAYRPASPTLDDIDRAFADPDEGYELLNPSQRHVFSAEDRGKYRLIGYITDGSSAIVMRDDQLQYFGFSSAIIENDDQLKGFFGADQLVRVRMNATEKAVRFLTSLPVKYFLVAVFLVAMLVELMMAGTGIGGAVALGALVLLIGPGAMIGLSGWWELIAIVIGIVCLAIEAFVIPGFGVFGIVGLVALFGGLIMTFVNTGGSMSNPNMQQDLMNGAVTVLLGFLTAGFVGWILIKNASSLPLLDQFILSGASGVGAIAPKSMLHAIVPDDGHVKVGSEGITKTPLHPIGQAEFGDDLIDVYALFGTIESGVPVRVVSATAMRIEVEPIKADSQPKEQAGDA